MSETGGNLINKSESSSFEDLASAAADEIEEAKLAEAAASNKSRTSIEAASEEWIDLLGSKSILKKLLKKGDEDEGFRPQRNDICRISYELRLRDGDRNLIEKRDNIKIYLGDNEVLHGIDLVLLLMYKGEECQLQIDPRFAYGETGLKAGESLGLVGETQSPLYDGPPIGPETWIEARLELHDWEEEPEHKDLTMAERMDIGARRRIRGNWWYGRGEPQLAVQLYRRALDALDESVGGITDPTATGEMPATSEALQVLLEERLRVQNNMAAAQLKVGAYDAALTAVSFVLRCQPSNLKALYRKACILTAMGKHTEALQAAKQAAALAPNDQRAKKELLLCEKNVNKDKSVERNLAKRMLGTNEPKPSADTPKPEKKPSRAKYIIWSSIFLSFLVGVASVLVYRYKMQSD